MARTPVCFRTKDLGCKNNPDDLKETRHSAYCHEHQPVYPWWWKELSGRKQCQCAGCGEVFTTVRTFDSHQTFSKGKVICKDPRRMFTGDKKRKLVLTVRGWAKNPELENFDTFARKGR